MSENSKKDRAPKDLSVPETMRIAALLAELMPPDESPEGAGVSFDVAQVTAVAAEPEVAAPALQTGELDDDGMVSLINPPAAPILPPPLPEQHDLPSATVNLRATPRVQVQRLPGSKAQIRLPAEPVMPISEQEPASRTTPSPVFEQPAKAPAAVEVETEFWQPNRKRAAARPAPLDPDLIPLGDLSAGSFFSLVNWRNDPERAKHPRRADYGLDEQTLALASRNPFYVIGRPRRPEERSVSEVLAEIAWE